MKFRSLKSPLPLSRSKRMMVAPGARPVWLEYSCGPGGAGGAGRFSLRCRKAICCGLPSSVTLKSAAVRSDGSVVAWGRDDYGVTEIPAGLSDVVAISGTGTHCLALTSAGLVFGWGSDDCGESGVPDILSGVTVIAAGYGHSLAVMPD